MKPDPVEQELQELAWRRPLSAEERARLSAWLAQHPDARAQWAADDALSAALARMPTRPAPSNLAARVLDEIDRGAAPGRARVLRWPAALRWLPRAAVAAVAIGGGVFWYQHHLTTEKSRELAQQAEALARLATVTELSPMPSAAALEDFDVILKLHPDSLADTELLAMSRQLAEFKP